MYRIWCTSNGQMGFREAWLKSNGSIREFETEQEAETVAAESRKTMNGPYALSHYTYEVTFEPLDSEPPA